MAVRLQVLKNCDTTACRNGGSSLGETGPQRYFHGRKQTQIHSRIASLSECPPVDQAPRDTNAQNRNVAQVQGDLTKGRPSVGSLYSNPCEEIGRASCREREK